MPEDDYPFNALDSGSATAVEKTAEPSTVKLQVLYLPEEKVGDATRSPFALIVSEMEDEPSEAEVEQWRGFKETIGAAAVMMTPRKIEVV